MVIASGDVWRPKNYKGPRIPQAAHEALSNVECNDCHRLGGEHTRQEISDCIDKIAERRSAREKQEQSSSPNQTLRKSSGKREPSAIGSLEHRPTFRPRYGLRRLSRMGRELALLGPAVALA